jgi:hypothetical protein
MKTTIKKTGEAVKEYINGLSDSELVYAHNQMCQNLKYGDDEIYSNDEDFFNTFFDNRVLEAVRAVVYGDYNYSHDWVKFNGYGNLESTNYPNDFIDEPQLIEDIINNPDDYYIEFEDEEDE